MPPKPRLPFLGLARSKFRWLDVALDRIEGGWTRLAAHREERRNQLVLDRRFEIPRWWEAIIRRANVAVESTFRSSAARAAGLLASAGGTLVVASVGVTPASGMFLYVGAVALSAGLASALLVYLYHACRGLAVDVEWPGPPYLQVVRRPPIPGLPPQSEYVLTLPHVRITSRENRPLTLLCHIRLRAARGYERRLRGGVSGKLPDGTVPMSQPLALGPDQKAGGALAFMVPGSSDLLRRLQALEQDGFVVLAVSLTVRDRRSGKAVNDVFAGQILASAIPPLR